MQDQYSPLASGLLDTIGSTRGSVLYRGASGWSALTPGTSTYVLTSNGAGADPSWQASGGGGGGFDPSAIGVDMVFDQATSGDQITGNPYGGSGLKLYGGVDPDGFGGSLVIAAGSVEGSGSGNRLTLGPGNPDGSTNVVTLVCKSATGTDQDGAGFVVNLGAKTGTGTAGALDTRDALDNTVFKVTYDGTITLANNSTGGGSASLGGNCPASTLTGPYTWQKVTTSDGSTGYVPIWK